MPVNIITSIDQPTHKIPTTYSLKQNHPNPFNPSTVISYQLPAVSHVDLSVYNLIRQKVATLVSEKKNAGYHQLEWDASGFASGMYYYRMSTDAGYVETRKLVLLK